MRWCQVVARRVASVFQPLKSFAVSSALLVLLAACSPNELEYRRSGIGSDLYSKDLAQATKNLEAYFGFICSQAGLGEMSAAGCHYNSWNTKHWAIFVQTGFNDIDRRCDGYLAWIEEVRNREAFGNSQLNALETLVRGVKVAVGSASVGSLAVVGEAFGYSQSLFTDYHRFLYNGLESSTIKTIVSQRRIAHRAVMRDVVIRYKPDSVNVLRSYLRICMPFTITMDANTFARSVATGNDLPIYTDPEVQKATLLGDGPFTPATRTNVRPSRGRVQVEGSTTQTEIDTGDPGTRSLQQAMCMGDTEVDGKFGPVTRAYIRDFQSAIYSNPADTGKITGELNPADKNTLLAKGQCPAGFRTYTERTELTGTNSINLLRAILKGQFPELKENASLDEMRPFIQKHRANLGLNNGPSNAFQDEVTTEYLNKIGFFG